MRSCTKELYFEGEEQCSTFADNAVAILMFVAVFVISTIIVVNM